jgi:Bacterial membrane protein YfhO
VEVAAATFLPLIGAIALVFATSRDRHFRAATIFFAALTALWLAPCWLTGQTGVALDFLTDAAPLQVLRPAGALQKNFLLNDVPLQMLPWREAVVESLRSGSPPFLDRHSGGGTPLWENLQAAILYPPNLLSIPFSTFAWPMFVMAAKFMTALIGMDLLLRQRALSHSASLFGSMAYGFGVFTAGYAMFPHSNVTTLLPLLLFTFERRAAGYRRAAAWSAVVLFVMFTGGHPESLLHCAFVAVPWCALIVARHREARCLLVRDLLLTGILALLLAAPLILPFAAYLPHTQRMHDLGASGFLSTPPFAPSTFIPFVIPNYFGNPRVQNYRHPTNFNELCSQFAGLTTLVFAVAVIWSRPRQFRWGLLLFAALLLLSTQPAWLQELVRGIPLLNITAHSRLRFALAFLMAVAGAEGFDLFIEGVERRRFVIAAAVVFAGVVFLAVVSYPTLAQYGVRRLVFFTEIAALAGCLLVTVRPPSRAVGRALIGLLFLDLFSVVGLYNPANPRALSYPDAPPILAMMRGAGPYRIAGMGRALQPNQAVFHHLEDIRPHDPMAFQPYLDVLARGGLDRSTYFEKFERLPPRVLLDFLGARYVIAAPGERRLSPLAAIYEGRDAVVFENQQQAKARYFIPRSVVAAGDPAGALLEASDADVAFSSAAHASAAATLRLVRYRPSSTLLTVDAPSPTFVATSESALPGWVLLRNGQPLATAKINGAFLGWDVPAGHSDFVLRYEPQHLRIGLIVALCGLLILAVWLRPLSSADLRREKSGSVIGRSARRWL